VVNDVTAHPPEDEGPDDLAALDFSPTGDHDERSRLDALDEYAPVDTHEVDNSQGPLFTVANPPGTVTVTTYLNGCVQHVGLSQTVTKMTEAELVQEIMAVTAVAATKARAALHTFVAGLLRLQGMDSASASDFAERRLSFPTPEQAAAAEAAFIARYADDYE
jgi:hypothetical protein